MLRGRGLRREKVENRVNNEGKKEGFSGEGHWRSELEIEVGLLASALPSHLFRGKAVASLAASLENGTGHEGLSPSRVSSLPVCGGEHLVSPQCSLRWL